MAWSVLDLSIITDDLKSLLTDAVERGSTAWKPPNGTGSIDYFGIEVRGSMPSTDRQDAEGCVLSLYLLHVSQDPTYRNVPRHGRGGHNEQQPLALNLYYLLTSYANRNYNAEQQAMSIAMRCFHERAIVRRPPAAGEYTITLEPQSTEESNRLWQALAVPLRLAVVYKVSVAIVTPSVEPAVPGPPTRAVGLLVAPSGGSATVAEIKSLSVYQGFTPPDGGVDVTPVAVAGLVRLGDALFVAGSSFDVAGYECVYLSGPGGESEITSWRDMQSADGFRINIPRTVGAVPANAPQPGNYVLCVGSDGPPRVRTPGINVRIAPRITPPDKMTAKLVPDAAGIYLVSAAGLTPAATVSVGPTTLVNVAGLPTNGQFAVGADDDGETLSFKLPNSLPSGRHNLAVAVNGVAAPPLLYVEL